MAARALETGNSICGTAKAAGIPVTTLHRWVQQAKLGSMSGSSRNKKRKPGRPRRSSKWAAEEKLRLLNEASALEGEDLGAFMRREGLHEADLTTMRTAALEGLAPPVKQHGPTAEEKRISKLESELRRKDKALAEAAALLVLQKKFRALMEEEGNDMDENYESNS